MKFILCGILSIFLFGCAHNEVVPPQDKYVSIDPKLLQYCEQLNEEVTITSFNDVITEYATLSIKYGICASKQSSSIKLLKQFGNIK